MHQDITRATTIRHLVDTFQQASFEIRAAFTMLTAAQSRVNEAFTLGGDCPIHIDASYEGHRDDFDNPDRCIERMARDAWKVIVDRLELRRMMSIERFARLEERLRHGPLPPITEEAITAFVQEHAVAIPDMFGEAVGEVFEWLRPRYSRYKTNSELEVPERVILSHVVELGWGGGGGKFRVNHYRQQNLQALENVFSGLDGQGMVSRGHYSLLETAINQSPDGTAETAYFRVRCHKNGNMHLQFRRKDLLARFNRMAGGRRMKPAQAAQEESGQ